jgi:ferric-dicitrate binding protein FerR (iron transport regulator)
MNITPEIIQDLFPLYAANECSEDTRRLVENYLKENPREAATLWRAQRTELPVAGVTACSDEMAALKEARRRLRWRSWLLGAAIFFSLAPFAFFTDGHKTWWVVLDAPKTAIVYGVLGAALWAVYAILRQRSHEL